MQRRSLVEFAAALPSMCHHRVAQGLAQSPGEDMQTHRLQIRFTGVEEGAPSPCRFVLCPSAQSWLRHLGMVPTAVPGSSATGAKSQTSTKDLCADITNLMFTIGTSEESAAMLRKDTASSVASLLKDPAKQEPTQENR